MFPPNNASSHSISEDSIPPVSRGYASDARYLHNEFLRLSVLLSYIAHLTIEFASKRFLCSLGSSKRTPSRPAPDKCQYLPNRRKSRKQTRCNLCGALERFDSNENFQRVCENNRLRSIYRWNRYLDAHTRRRVGAECSDYRLLQLFGRMSLHVH